MAKTLLGGGASPKPTTSAGATAAPGAYPPKVGLTSPMDSGHAMAGSDAGGTAALSTTHSVADPKKKKLDWQAMVKSGLNAASNSIDDQADPMAIMQQIANMAGQSRGQIIQ